MKDGYECGQRGARTSLGHLLEKCGPSTATHFAMGMLDYSVAFVIARMGRRRAYEILQRRADCIATHIMRDEEPRG